MYRFATTTAALLALSGASAASGAVIHSFEFNTDGDAEGWTTALFSGTAVSGGSLTATAHPTNNDPKLFHNPDLAPTAGFTWTTVEYRFRRTDGGSGGTVQTTYDPSGTIIRFNGANSTIVPTGPDVDNFFTVTADISSYGSTPLTTIRIDPIGGTNGLGDYIEVDYIRFSDSSPVPEPGSLALLGLGGAMFIRRRRRA